jgi:PAS domain S-box-containing protein
MFEQLQNIDEMVNTAVGVAAKRDDTLLTALDQLAAPIYVTDAEGFITYFNPSCVGFAGRTPTVGKDRWCVTWKLFTDAGEFLPHDRCPMADAIHGKREIRGVSAIAERPDGTRVHFMPYPTPLLSEDGELLGAVNILIDVTEQRQAGELRAQAVRCRRLSNAVGDAQASGALERMAKEYDQKAIALARGKSLR